MRLRFAVAVLSSLLLAPLCSSRAQTGVYAQVTGQSSDASFGSGTFWGSTFGFYQDRHSIALLHLGIDARGLILKNGNVTQGSGLAGLRASVVPHVFPVKLYAEALGGVSVANSTNFQYQVNGGLEYTVLPHVDWRAVEVAYNGYSSGGAHPVGLSTGLVFRLF